ncbi:MAG: hypothetical protein ACFCU5_20610 [Pleurocapsa sp.]
MGLKVVENFNTSFSLNPESKNILVGLLSNESFTTQVSQQLKESCIEFTQLLFQPVPYSQHTPKGMPVEFEEYYNSKDHIIINVPPNFMFQAKIFKPSRLCAIYRKVND